MASVNTRVSIPQWFHEQAGISEADNMSQRVQELMMKGWTYEKLQNQEGSSSPAVDKNAVLGMMPQVAPISA